MALPPEATREDSLLGVDGFRGVRVLRLPVCALGLHENQIQGSPEEGDPTLGLDHHRGTERG